MSGYLTWSTPVGKIPPELDGGDAFLVRTGEGADRPHSTVPGSPGAVFRMLAEEDRLQVRWLAPDIPVGLSPATWSYRDIFLRDEDTFWRIKSAERRGVAVTWYADTPILDAWSVDRAPAAQSTWQLSRSSAWGVVGGVDLVTRPPIALLDGVALTLAASSPPAAGEFFVGAADANGYATLETDPSGISGSWLELRYHALHRVRVAGVEITLQAPNGLRASMQLEELRQRRWS